MNINLDLYRCFCEVAKSGNATKAAEKLFISQSAVSQSIKQLEAGLGTKLFDRTVRGMTLTPEGEVLYSYVSNALGLIESAQDKLAALNSFDEGLIKIGASDTICSILLLRFLKNFNVNYPNIHISVLDSSTIQSIKLIKNGSVDLSFVTLPTVEDSAVEITPIMPIHDCFVAGEKYAHLINTIMKVEDLKKYPLLMLERGSNSRKQIDRFFASHGLEVEPTIEFASVGLLPKFAKEGMGIATTIKEDVQDMLDSGELFELQLNHSPPARQIALAQMRNVSLSAAAQAFKTALVEWIGR